MGKKTKRYEANRKDARRKAKRKDRKQRASVGTSYCKHTVTEEDDSHRSRGQLDSNSGGCDLDSAVDEKERDADRKVLKAVKADCQRLREMLYYEQRLPKYIQVDCLECLRRRQVAHESLKTRMFSGTSFGSRYLLAALKNKQQQ